MNGCWDLGAIREEFYKTFVNSFELRLSEENSFE
jgi:hypothetical protein